MMNYKTQFLFVILFVFCFWGKGQSHDHNQKVNYKKNPHWIDMMKDPNVNYHEAVKAFNEFWKDRYEPEEEGEEKHEKEKRSLKKLFKSEEKEKAESFQYVMQYRCFKKWRDEQAPFVQDDGTILSKEEQLQIWENARK